MVSESEEVFVRSVELFQHTHTAFLRDLASDLGTVFEIGLLEHLSGKVAVAVTLDKDAAVDAR